jgi:hypothetical protein
MAVRDRDAIWAVPLAAALLLWPAIWNGYPIVFADTGTYLSQAIHRYLGWDRPPFYSLFMLPLHMTVSLWPVVVVQAVLAVCTIRLVCGALLPGIGARWLPVVVLPLAIGTWLPFLVCQLMPDVFTPMLVLVLCAGLPRWRWAAFAAFAIAAQQSSLLLSAAILSVLVMAGESPPSKTGDGGPSPAMTRWRLFVPPVLAIAALLSVNLIGHGRLAISPFGNVFLLARVIYDGPGMDVLRRDCPAVGWRLCAFLDRFPPTSDEFLWQPDSPIVLAGGHKAVSADADAIIAAALFAEPSRELRAILRNGREQMTRFASGDGLEAWPIEVTPWIEQDFPPAEAARYASGLQAQGLLALPPWLALLHRCVILGGTVWCACLLHLAFERRHRAAAFLLVALVILPASAVITGGLSTPHDRYQSRIAWLPPFVAALSAVAILRRPA